MAGDGLKHVLERLKPAQEQWHVEYRLLLKLLHHASQLQVNHCLGLVEKPFSVTPETQRQGLHHASQLWLIRHQLIAFVCYTATEALLVTSQTRPASLGRIRTWVCTVSAWNKVMMLTCAATQSPALQPGGVDSPVHVMHSRHSHASMCGALY